MAGMLSQAAGAGAMTPQLAEAAAAAGAPPPGAGAQAEPEAAPPGAGPPQAGPAPAPAAPQPGAGPQQKSAGGQGASPLDPYMQQADPQEQQEYERAIRSMARVLYANDQTANSIVDQIRPDNLVSDTAKVSMLFIKELDRKINMDQNVIAELTREVVERISELAEARHGITYQAADLEKVLGATWEGVQTMFGGGEDPQGFSSMVQSMSPETLQALKQQQEAILKQQQPGA